MYVLFLSFFFQICFLSFCERFLKFFFNKHKKIVNSKYKQNKKFQKQLKKM